MPTLREALCALTTPGRIEARHEAEMLLCHALGCDRAWLFAHGDDSMDAEVGQRFRELMQARARGEPVAYLIVHRGFWTLDLQVNRDVLIPRAETELLVELALARIAVDTPTRVADLGTGSGAVALAIASERPQARVLATDASAAALDVARANARRLQLDAVEFAVGDWCAALGSQRFHAIVSNPPYIASGDHHLSQGDLRFEPAAALASGCDGLDAIRSIVQSAPSHLLPQGWLLLEHGYDQGERVRALLDQHGFDAVQTWPDIAGNDRVSGGKRS
jgi:release factor glutamine methyltransferase